MTPTRYNPQALNPKLLTPKPLNPKLLSPKSESGVGDHPRKPKSHARGNAGAFGGSLL